MEAVLCDHEIRLVTKVTDQMVMEDNAI